MIGTRFTTGCGHSWKRRYPKWTAGELRYAETDCIVCGELLMILVPDDVPPDSFPAHVHCPLFHVHLSIMTGGDWPADGHDTFTATFAAE
ncbi:hypothetical protein [Streptomyces canus]|uniref:hypothetical protein n=1 Tax=Streptomyces canus TaxID=58343 RepID=UPI00131DEC17|nr:hypothetical protein [Streptomyces canus]